MKYQSFNHQNYVAISLFSCKIQTALCSASSTQKPVSTPHSFLFLLALEMLFIECKNATTSAGTRPTCTSMTRCINLHMMWLYTHTHTETEDPLYSWIYIIMTRNSILPSVTDELAYCQNNKYRLIQWPYAIAISKDSKNTLRNCFLKKKKKANTTMQKSATSQF